MEEDELFDEFYAKLKDIVNSAFNLGETIPEPKIVRKVLKSLPERFHAKITAIEELKDIDKIPLTELVENLQTYKLGLTRIWKSSKSKSMVLKAKSSDTDKSLDDEDSSVSRGISRSLRRMPMREDLTKIKSNPVLRNSRVKTKGRRMLGMTINILYPQDQSALGVRALVT